MTGERVAVTSNGREYTWRGTRWTYEPKNNHGRTEVHRTSRLHFALCELASLRAQVAALAGEKERSQDVIAGLHQLLVMNREANQDAEEVAGILREGCSLPPKAGGAR